MCIRDSLLAAKNFFTHSLGVARISKQSGWHLVDFFQTKIVVNVEDMCVLEQNDNFTESDWSKKST